MNLKWKPFHLLVLTAMILLPALTITAQDVVNLTVTVWVGQTDLEALEELADVFEEANPNIAIEYLNIPDTGDFGRNTVQQMIAGGTPPDVMILNTGQFETFAARGVLLALDDLVERDGVDLGIYFPEAISGSSFDGVLYGMPRDISNHLVYLNVEMFEAAGVDLPDADWTWDDYRNIAQALTMDTDGDGAIDQWGASIINVASGNVPDMINIAIDGVQLAVSKGLLLPLDDFLASDPEGEAFLELIPQQLLDALSVDGTLYMMPNGWQTMVIHYNTDIFTNAGMDCPSADWTWDDFLETAQALTNDDHFGFGVFWGNFQLHPWWLTNDSYSITEDASASNLNDPKFIEAVSFMNDLVNTHGVSPDPLGMNPADLFANGAFAMAPAGRWPIPGWKAAGFTSFDVVPWPKKETQNTVFGCAGWGISPESSNPELAWQAIKELISVETITAVMKLGHQIPPLRSVAQDPSFLEAPDNAELFFDVIDTTRPVASPPYFTDLERIQMRNLERVIIGDASPEEAMNEAHEELNDAIERFNS